MANLAFKYNTVEGYWDLFAENGKLSTTKGLDSQILMSLFVDSRADDSEISTKENQKGWAGNLYMNLNYPSYEIGCKQWVYYEQGKTTRENAEAILDTVKNDGFQWFVDDGLAEDIQVEINELDFINGNMSLDFTFKIDENNTESFSKKIELWNNTKYK